MTKNKKLIIKIITIIAGICVAGGTLLYLNYNNQSISTADSSSKTVSVINSGINNGLMAAEINLDTYPTSLSEDKLDQIAKLLPSNKNQRIVIKVNTNPYSLQLANWIKNKLKDKGYNFTEIENVIVSTNCPDVVCVIPKDNVIVVY